MEKKIRIIDKRTKEKYIMDDAYLNGYARLCGWKATLVYMSLCRHVNKDQFCFPSIKLMAEEHGVGRDAVIDGVKKLKEWNIIETSQQKRGKQGLWKSGSYTLLDKSVWLEKPHGVDISDPDDGVDISVVRSRRGRLDGVAVVDTKETHIEGNTLKETHIAKAMAKPVYGKPEINEILAYLEEKLDGVPMDGGKKNRNYAQLMLNEINKLCVKQGYDKSKSVPIIKSIINAAFQGWHKKNATSVQYIYRNMGKIIQESKEKSLNVLTV